MITNRRFSFHVAEHGTATTAELAHTGQMRSVVGRGQSWKGLARSLSDGYECGLLYVSNQPLLRNVGALKATPQLFLPFRPQWPGIKLFTFPSFAASQEAFLESRNALSQLLMFFMVERTSKRPQMCSQTTVSALSLGFSIWDNSSGTFHRALSAKYGSTAAIRVSLDDENRTLPSCLTQQPAKAEGSWVTPTRDLHCNCCRSVLTSV